MPKTGKEYQLAIRIAGIVDKSLSTSLVATQSKLSKTVAAINKDFVSLDKGFNSIVSTGKRCFSATAAAAGVAAAAIGATVANCTKAASEFEYQMADVTKYVNGLADAAGRASEALALDVDGNVLNGKTYAQNYQEMKEALLDLSTQIPMTAEELTRLAAAAGQSGYGIDSLLQYDSKGNIAGFLKDTAVMGTAMDISAEQAGDWAAKWEKAFNMTHGEIMVLADQINYLGANSATTAAEIAQVVNDSASLGQIAGIDVSTTAALADAMLATGVSNDKVATSIKRTITNMVKGTSATKAMKTQWEELGFTAEGVAMAMQDDSIGTLKSVFEAIGNLPDYKQVAALSTLFGQWAIEGDAKIVGNMKVFQDALDMVSDPAKYSGSMEREFVIKASTSESIDTMVSNAFQAMKINIGDSFLPIKKEYSQKLIEFIGNMTEKMASFNDYLSGADGLSKWMKNAEAQFPIFQRKFKKYAEPVFSVIMNAGKFIVKHGRGIISILAGIGAALAAYKAASSIVHIVNAIISLGSLNPVTLGIMGVVAAIGALVGAYTLYKQHEQKLADQSLADHFGSISLSMGEIQRVAEEIVRTGSLAGVREALSAFDTADGILNNLQNYIDELNLMNWKVSVGLELTEEEQDSYRSAIENYISELQQYAVQERYAVSLNLAVGLSGENSDIISKVDQFYAESYAEMQRLGDDLAKAVTEAFADGVLDPTEADYIAELQKNLADVQSALATSDFEAGLIKMQMEYGSGAALDSASFQNLQAELSEQVETVKEEYLESYSRTVTAINNTWEKGGFDSYDEYQNALTDAQLTYYTNLSAALNSAAQFQLDALENAFGGDISSALDEMLQDFTENSLWDWTERTGVLFLGMQDSLSKDKEFKPVRKAMQQRLKEMQGTIEAMEEMKANYDAMILSGAQLSEADRESYKTISELLSRAGMMEGVAGLDMGEGYWKVLGEQIVKGGYSEYYEEVFAALEAREQEVESYGGSPYIAVPQGLYEGIDRAANEAAARIEESAIRPAVEGMYTWTQEAIDEYYTNAFEANADLNLTLDTYIRMKQMPDLDGMKRNILSNFPIDSNADGGFIRSPELSWLAENGPEAVIPLDGSRNAVSLWEKAGQLMGMGNRFDNLDLNGGDTVTVSYSPVLNFYGAAPSREDLTEALDISQEKFDACMERYIKKYSRVSFR